MNKTAMELLAESDDSEDDTDINELIALRKAGNQMAPNMQAPNTTRNATAKDIQTNSIARQSIARGPRLSVINKESDDSDDADDEYVKLIMAQNRNRNPVPTPSNASKQRTISVPQANDVVSDSSSDDMDMSNQLNNRSSQVKPKTPHGSKDNTTVSTSLQQQYQQIHMLDIMQLIEHNEKMNESAIENSLEASNALLSFDSEYYSILKQRIKFSTYSELTPLLFEAKDHRYYGVCSVVAMLDNFLFIGNSSGIIRCIHSKHSKEMKPLKDPDLDRIKVTAISITPDGMYLVSGYQKGMLAIWDLKEYKLLQLLHGVHEGMVTQCHIYAVAPGGTKIQIISSEDIGRVSLVTVTRNKGFFGGISYDVETQYLMSNRLKGCNALVPFIPDTSVHNNPVVDRLNLVAIGALNEVVVCSLSPIGELYKSKRPSICKHNSMPVFDWGYGLTPTQQEDTMPLMVMAWDTVIQVFYLDVHNGKARLELDGFYISETEINAIHFVSDSVVVVLANQAHIKVLYTKKFQPGHYMVVENDRSMINQVIDMSKHCVLETCASIDKICASILTYPEKVNERGQVSSQPRKVMNFSASVVKNKRQIIYLTANKIVRGKLYTYTEYLDKLRHSDNHSWLTVLKAALEIYNGDLKGFAKVSDEKERREHELKGFMKELIKNSLQVNLRSYGRNHDDPNQRNLEMIAIKVAVEFCLNIQETDYLFGELYDLFITNGLKKSFLQNLEPFIITGKFRDSALPELIVREVVTDYEVEKKYKVLDRMVQQLNWNGSHMKEELKVTCQTYNLVSALLYLIMSDVEESNTCMQILNNMYKMIESTRVSEQIALKKHRGFRQKTKEDLYQLLKVNIDHKYELEKSHCYIGYKLLWIISLFLEGKKYPYGRLTSDQHKAYVKHIVIFITTEDYLNSIIDFDAKELFKILGYLYLGEAWSYFKDLKEEDIQLIAPEELLTKLETKGRILQTRGDPSVLQNFFWLVIQVMVYQIDQKSKKTLDLDDKLAFEALKSVLSPDESETHRNTSLIGIMGQMAQKKKEEFEQKSEMIIDVIRNQQSGNLKCLTLNDEKITELLLVLTKHQELTPGLQAIKIELYEARGSYVDAFNCVLENQQPDRCMFKWIEKTLTMLQNDDVAAEALQNFSQALKNQLEKVARVEYSNELEDAAKGNVKKILLSHVDGYERQLYCQKTVNLARQLFGSKISEERFFFLQDLSRHPKVQFHFMETYFDQNMEDIERVVSEAVHNQSKKEQADAYQEYLAHFCQLLCDQHPDSVEEWLKLPAFPEEACMDICKRFNNDGGLYILKDRMGLKAESIQILLDIINRIDCKRMLDQFTIINSREEETRDARWDMGRVSNYKDGLGKFDQYLDKAINIAASAELKQFGNHEDAWFTILEFLQKYIEECPQKIEAAVKRINRSSYKSRQVSHLTEGQVQANMTKRLQEFVMMRISGILKLDQLDISVKTILDRLQLNFTQVKQIFYMKVADQNNIKRLKLCSQKILEKDNYLVARQNVEFARRGFHVSSWMTKADRELHSNQRCGVCRRPILQYTVPTGLVCFVNCNHAFHKSCLEGDLSHCPRCEKRVIKNIFDTKDGDQLQDVESAFGQLNAGQVNQEEQQAAAIRANHKKHQMRLLQAFDDENNQAQLKAEDFEFS